MPPNMCKNYPISPSAESESGLSYKCANGTKIPDLGKRKVKAKCRGQQWNFSSNVADVHKFLMAVSSITAKGNGVWFAPQTKVK